MTKAATKNLPDRIPPECEPGVLEDIEARWVAAYRAKRDAIAAFEKVDNELNRIRYARLRYKGW